MSTTAAFFYFVLTHLPTPIRKPPHTSYLHTFHPIFDCLQLPLCDTLYIKIGILEQVKENTAYTLPSTHLCVLCV